MNCPHCEAPVFRLTPDGSRLKARTTILVLHKSGGAEINCDSCGKGVIVPLQPTPGPLVLKKAEPPPQRFIVRKQA